MSDAFDLAGTVLAPAAGLQYSRQGRDGRIRYVVSDARRGSHASLRADAYRLLGELDGRRSLREIYAAGGVPLPEPEAAARAVLQLHSAGLVKTVSGQLPPAPLTAKPPPEAKLVSWRRELVDLGPWLPAADRWLGWMFTRPAVLAWTLLVAVGIWVLADRWAPTTGMVAWLAQLGAGEALGLYMVFLLLKALHELGHAVAYRRLAAAEGLKVSSVRAGVSIIFLLPFPFTDVTGAWRIASRWRRAMVGAAGMYVESWAGLIALLIWGFADDPVLRSVAGQVAFVAGLTTILFNLNPLGRMDGYYILSDAVERPNLGRQASQAAMTLLARFLGALPENRSGHVEPAILAYWVGALLFRVGIYVTLFWAALRTGAVVAVVVLLIAGSLLVARPIATNLRWLRSIAPDPARLRGRLLALAAAVGVVLLLPLPSTVDVVGVVERKGLTLLYPPRAAALTTDGALAFSSREARLELAELDARRRQAFTRWRYALEDGQGIARTLAAEAQALDAEALRLGREIARLDADLAGRDVTPLDLDDRRGSWVPVSGRPIAVRMPSDRYRIRAVGRERDRSLLAAGQGGEARPFGRPELGFDVRVAAVEDGAASSLPSAALGRPFGGPIAVDPSDGGGRRPAEPVVTLVADAVGRAPALRHGQRVELRIEGPRRPLVVQWIDGLLRTLGAPAAAA